MSSSTQIAGMRTYIDVWNPVMVSCILVIAGIAVYWIFWIRDGYNLTPVYDIESRVYHSSDKDKNHRNPFSFLFEAMRIIHSDRALPFINRYGIDMYFFFQIRLYFLQTMVYIFFGLAFMIVIAGMITFWHDDRMIQFIKLRIFGGGCQTDANRNCLIGDGITRYDGKVVPKGNYVSADLQDMNRTYFNTIAYQFVTLMLAWTVWRLIHHYNRVILHLYEYSELIYQYEKKQTYFWYNMRTIFSPHFGQEDLLGTKMQSDIDKLTEKGSGLGSDDLNLPVRALKCFCIPDFIGIMQPAIEQAYLRARFYEVDIEEQKCSCCYTKKWHNWGAYQEKLNECDTKIEEWFDPDKRLMDKIEKKAAIRKTCPCFQSKGQDLRDERDNKLMGSTMVIKDSVKSSTFGFILADSVWGAGVLSFELYRSMNTASSFIKPIIDYFENLKKEKEENKMRELQTQEEMDVRRTEAFDSKVQDKGLSYRPDGDFQGLNAPPTKLSVEQEAEIAEKKRERDNKDIDIDKNIGNINYYI